MGKGGEQQFSTTSTIDEGVSRRITWQELSNHREPDNAWIAYKGKVYDISQWKDHPGGSVIYTHAGDDCTDIFTAFHPATAVKDLDQFFLGMLDDSDKFTDKQGKEDQQKQKAFEKAYRELRAKMITLGLFNASASYYTYKCISTLSILGLSIACVVVSKNLMVNLLGGIFLGIFWQQCGWLGHDYFHHQVFKNRFYGDLVGFSTQWWKTKHNSHHAVPNLHESSPSAADGDPDIDTMPLLAWSSKMAEYAKGSSWGRFFITYQQHLYFPLLLFARLAWAHQSWVYLFGGVGQHSIKGAKSDREKNPYATAEKVLLIIHYIWMLYVLSLMPILNAICYFLIAQVACGLSLALVFGVGHNGMSVYPANQRPDFWKLQVSTTRNITSNWFIDWFCGGLHYQVEHHLFPSMPRHNLKVAHKLVESFCAEHGLTYHEADLITGNVEVLQHLSKISREFLEHFPAM